MAEPARAARTASEPPLIALERVEKRFANGTLAVTGLDLRIGRHEFVSLLGPSGCGKSTALRMIAGLGSPSSGRIHWPGHQAGGRPARGEVGFVFQEPTLMPWARVAANIRRPLALIGVTGAEADRRTAETLEMVGLTDFARAFPRELSGGMRMRVSIARALATRPKVLLMDEPFAALDEITRFRLNEDLLDLWRTHSWTVVFVTHSVFESVFLSNRIVVMTQRPGRVHADVPIEAPYPRSHAFRMTEAYNHYCRDVSRALGEAMAEPGTKAFGEAVAEPGTKALGDAVAEPGTKD
jgi:NitT/TauT family transport system ATP-binding protein